MAKVELRDCHKGQEALTVDEVIERLTKIRDEHKCGTAKVFLWMEPTIDGQTHQISESLCEVSAAVSYVKQEYQGVETVNLLGRSFD